MPRTFRLDLEQIRARAQKNLEDGPLTAAYDAQKAEVVDVLNEVLATEIVCALRYQNNQFVARGQGAIRVAEEFAEHAAEETAHRDRVAERIDQLGGLPNFNPVELANRSHVRYATAESLSKLIEENLVAERIAVDSYSQIVRWLGDKDPTTRRMMEELLQQEEEHADDLVNLRERVQHFTG